MYAETHPKDLRAMNVTIVSRGLYTPNVLLGGFFCCCSEKNIFELLIGRTYHGAERGQFDLMD